MGQEDDRDKPPYAVQARVFTQGWYLIQVDRDRLKMGLYVRLVTRQIEPITELRQIAGEGLKRHSVQGSEKPFVISAFYRADFDGAGPRAGQHLADALAELVLSFSMLGHLLPEVFGIKHEAIEQVPRANFLPTVSADIPPYFQLRLSSAIRAPLERKGRVHRCLAARAARFSFLNHLKRAAATLAAMPRQHNLVIELPDSLRESFRGVAQAKCSLDKVYHDAPQARQLHLHFVAFLVPGRELATTASATADLALAHAFRPAKTLRRIVA